MYSETIVDLFKGEKKIYSVALGYIVTYVNNYTPAFMDNVYKNTAYNTNVLLNVNDSYL